MSDHVYKIVEIVGSSKIGVDDAIRNAIENDGYIVFFNFGRDDESGLYRSITRFQSINLR